MQELCNKCKNPIDEKWKFCAECGTKIPMPVYRLLNDGEYIREGDEYWNYKTGKWASCHGCIGVPNNENASPKRRKIKSYQE